MFDQKEIEAYRKITAPDTLRDKVMSSCADTAPRKNAPLFYMKRISAIAACFVLVAVLSVFAAQNFGGYSVAIASGELPRERSVAYDPASEPAPLAIAREADEAVITLSIDGRCELTVSDGTLYLADEENGELTDHGPRCEVGGETLVHWTVRADDKTQTFEMTVRGTFKTEKLILQWDEAGMTWTLTRLDK